MVSASPVAVWFACNVSEITANSSASAIPATSAASTPIEVIPVSFAVAKAGDGAGQHHAFDAEVQNADFLDDQFPGRGEQQWRGGGDGADEKSNQQSGHGMALAGVGAGRIRGTHLTRCSNRKSHPNK